MNCFVGFRNAFLTILLSFYIAPAYAELILSAPPRESAEAGERDYGPLAEYLSKELGEKVTYKHPTSWPRYQRGIRSDKYDIVFDGPHFMSWRMKKKNHAPVAKLPGNLSFVLIARTDDNEIKAVEDLINEEVCAIPPPNLSTLTVITRFGDVGQSKLKTIKGGMGGVYAAFKKGECRGAILRDKFYANKVPSSDREKTKILFTSDPLPNQGITVSDRVSKEAREKIAKLLVSKNSGTAPVLKRFSPKAETMMPVDEEEYKPHYKLLSGVIIGW